MKNLTIKRLTRLGVVLTTLALMASLHPARAQLAETWVHRDASVSSNAFDRAVQIAMDASGDLVVTGITAGGISGTDIVTIKYSGATGATLWQQRYNGPDGMDDEPAALAVVPGGDILICEVLRRDWFPALGRALRRSRQFGAPPERVSAGD